MDVVAAPDSLMRPLAFRRLTVGERALCAEVFGEGLDAGRIWMFALPIWSRPFVPGAGLIVWPATSAMTDFSQAPLWLRSVLVHELVHVWQAQHGIFLPFAKLKAGDRPRAYAYDPEDGRGLEDLNIEQQAMVVQHAYLAAGGGSAPFPAEVYLSILAAWPEPLGARPREI